MSYSELNKAIEIIKQLHDPEKGCPWDLEQTHQSLTPYLLEESYEFIDAVEQKSPELMEEEIGDVLLQVLHHCTMAQKNGSFSIESVAKKLNDKMIRRHPHVFSQDKQKENLKAEDVSKKWQELKNHEKSSEKKYSINYKLIHNAALESSFKIGQKSTTVNFDWENYHQVMNKVEEEWQELKSELPPGNQYNKKNVKEEIGDLLFSVAQLARHLELNPEDCLREANKKFIRRFQKVEDEFSKSGKTMMEATQEELEIIWSKVKTYEKS